jgi:hypothetical protein
MTRRPQLKGWPRLFARPEKLTRSRRFDRKQNLFPEDSIVKSQLISLSQLAESVSVRI